MKRLIHYLGRLGGRVARAEAGALGFDELPVALIQLDAAGTMLRGNRGWELLSGRRVGDCLGLDHRQFLHIEDRNLWQQAMQGLETGAAPWVGSLRYLGPAGELHWVEVRLARRPGALSPAWPISAPRSPCTSSCRRAIAASTTCSMACR